MLWLKQNKIQTELQDELDKVRADVHKMDKHLAVLAATVGSALGEKIPLSVD